MLLNHKPSFLSVSVFGKVPSMGCGDHSRGNYLVSHVRGRQVAGKATQHLRTIVMRFPIDLGPFRTA